MTEKKRIPAIKLNSPGKKIAVSFRFTEDTVDQLKSLANFHGLSDTKTVEQLIQRAHDMALSGGQKKKR